MESVARFEKWARKEFQSLLSRVLTRWTGAGEDFVNLPREQQGPEQGQEAEQDQKGEQDSRGVDYKADGLCWADGLRWAHATCLLPGQGHQMRRLPPFQSILSRVLMKSPSPKKNWPPPPPSFNPF